MTEQKKIYERILKRVFDQFVKWTIEQFISTGKVLFSHKVQFLFLITPNTNLAYYHLPIKTLAI